MDPVDERSRLEFEEPRNLAEVFPSRIDAPPELRKCSRCGKASQALPASKLTVIKHHAEGVPLGTMYLYCGTHLQSAGAWGEGGGLRSAGRIGDPCPKCFIATSLSTGACDSCD